MVALVFWASLCVQIHMWYYLKLLHLDGEVICVHEVT